MLTRIKGQVYKKQGSGDLLNLTPRKGVLMLILTSMNAGLKLKTKPFVLMGVDLTGSMKPILQLTALLFLIFFVPEPLVLTDWFIR